MNREEFSKFVSKVLEDVIQFAEEKAGQKLPRRFAFQWLGRSNPRLTENIVEQIVKRVFIDEEHIYPCVDLGVADLLEDGLLLIVGNVSGHAPRPFGKGKSVVRIQVLNYERNTVHVFEFNRLHKVIVDIPSADPLWFTPGGTLGQIYSYEIVALSSKVLQIVWLLDSGGTITIEFEKLIYRRQNAKSQR